MARHSQQKEQVKNDASRYLKYQIVWLLCRRHIQRDVRCLGVCDSCWNRVYYSSAATDAQRPSFVVDPTGSDNNSRSIGLPVFHVVYGLAGGYSVAFGNFTQLPCNAFDYPSLGRDRLGCQLLDRIHHRCLALQARTGAKLGLDCFASSRIYHFLFVVLRECFSDAVCAHSN